MIRNCSGFPLHPKVCEQTCLVAIFKKNFLFTDLKNEELFSKVWTDDYVTYYIQLWATTSFLLNYRFWLVNFLHISSFKVKIWYTRLMVFINYNSDFKEITSCRSLDISAYKTIEYFDLVNFRETKQNRTEHRIEQNRTE